MISVLVVIYDAADYIQTAIDSVLNQTYTDLEILLLDDGSTDPRVGPICQAAEADDRVEWVRFGTTNVDRQQRVTYASNINWGAKNSSGEYLTFLAGDDYYHLDRCERMVAKLAEGHDCVYGSQERPNANGRFVPAPATHAVANLANVADMSSVMVRRRVFESACGFDTAYQNWGDADAHFFQRVADCGFVFEPVDGPDRPTDGHPYRDGSIQERWNKGLEPWT